MREQPLLALEAAAVPDEAAVRADDADVGAGVQRQVRALQDDLGAAAQRQVAQRDHGS